MRKTILAALLLASCSKTEPPAPPAAPGGTGKVEVISNGEGYAIANHVVPGYATVLYFYADW